MEDQKRDLVFTEFEQRILEKDFLLIGCNFGDRDYKQSFSYKPFSVKTREFHDDDLSQLLAEYVTMLNDI